MSELVGRSYGAVASSRARRCQIRAKRPVSRQPGSARHELERGRAGGFGDHRGRVAGVAVLGAVANVDRCVDACVVGLDECDVPLDAARPDAALVAIARAPEPGAAWTAPRSDI